MDFYVMTLFPEMITNALSTSIIGRAMEHGLIGLHAVNIRDYTLDKHKRVDDYPYGGGAGMVMQAQPICDCYEAIQKELARKHKERKESETESHGTKLNGTKTNEAESHGTETNNEEKPTGKEHKTRVIYLTPQGQVFHQKMAEELAQEEELIFLCGHYEGIDERALERIVTDNVSIGDYVLTGGEMPAMIMIDAISRLVPGVLNNKESAEFESFQDNLLEYPQYTRPEDYEGQRVPEVLLSGHHAKIEAWRREQSLLRTKERRPDLLSLAELSEKEQQWLQEDKTE